MYLYLIKRTDDVGHDETESVIIAALAPAPARKIAQSVRGDQLPEVWLSASIKNIGKASRDIKPGIVHTAFREG